MCQIFFFHNRIVHLELLPVATLSIDAHAECPPSPGWRVLVYRACNELLAVCRSEHSCADTGSSSQHPNPNPRRATFDSFGIGAYRDCYQCADVRCAWVDQCPHLWERERVR